MRAHCAIYMGIPEHEVHRDYIRECLNMRVHCALYWTIPEDESPMGTILENT
jgi:hypothetical protein